MNLYKDEGVLQDTHVSARPLWVNHLPGDIRWSLAPEKSCFSDHCVSGCLPENQNAPWLLLHLYDFVTSKEQQNGK